MSLTYKDHKYYWKDKRLMDFFISARECLKAQIALERIKEIDFAEVNKAYNELDSVLETVDELFVDDAYVKECEKCTKRMMPDDFYIEYNNYECPTFIDKLDGFPAFAGYLRDYTWQKIKSKLLKNALMSFMKITIV